MTIRSRVSLGSFWSIAKRPTLLLRVPGYCRDLRRYLVLQKGKPRWPLRLYPCLDDRRSEQNVGGFYFYQDTWAARQVFRENPAWMADIGSTTLFVGILSQFTCCVSVDVRPMNVGLRGLEIRKGSAVTLPFGDCEVPCLTTMCVLEHIGLGRYGDEIDPAGTERAVAEIARVIRPGGIVVFSVPIGEEILEFNAHRRFSLHSAESFFLGWEVVDRTFLAPNPHDSLTPEIVHKGDVVACFCLRKPLGQTN